MKDLKTIIEEGNRQVNLTMSDIMREFQIRRDILIKSNKIDFDFDDKLEVFINKNPYSLTDWSQGQLLLKASLPTGYYETMMKAGQKDLIITNLKTMLPALQNSIMVREVGDTIKGVLSASYKRMDASPMFSVFIEEMLKSNYFPYKAYNTDMQYQIRFLYPEALTIGNDEILIGYSISTSDYGARSFSIEVFIIRLVCQNGMIGMDVMRRRHIGKRVELDEDYSIYSSKTIALENKSFQSKIRDILRKDDTVKLLCGKIKDTQDREIWNSTSFLEKIKELTKEDRIKAEVLFHSKSGIELLPKEKSVWRMANVISLLSKSEDNQDKAIRMEELAMNLIAS